MVEESLTWYEPEEVEYNIFSLNNYYRSHQR